MKTIAVIGASGKSGKEFVKLALANGYHVKAGIYSHSTLEPHENLEIIKGDATKAKDIAILVKDSDVVVSLIGHGRKSPKWLITDTMKALVPVLEASGPKRLISLTGTGVRMLGDTLSPVDQLLHIPLKLAIGAIIDDGIAHAEVLNESKLDYTIIRALILNNSKAGSFSLRAHGPAKTFVPRATVAQAILQTIEDRSFIRQAPIIGK